MSETPKPSNPKLRVLAKDNKVEFLLWILDGEATRAWCPPSIDTGTHFVSAYDETYEIYNDDEDELEAFVKDFEDNHSYKSIHINRVKTEVLKK